MADFFFFSSTVQSNPDSIGKKRGVGRREKTSLVREVYEMERGGEKYLKIRTKDCGGCGGWIIHKSACYPCTRSGWYMGEKKAQVSKMVD